MNIIFISPNYPAGHKRFALALHNEGYNVLGIGDAGAESFPPMLRGCLAEYCRVPDLHDSDAVYRACAYLCSKYGAAERIISLNPYWLDLESAMTQSGFTKFSQPEDFYSVAQEKRISCASLPSAQIYCSDADISKPAISKSCPALLFPVKDKRLGELSVSSKKELEGLTPGAYYITRQKAGDELLVSALALGKRLYIYCCEKSDIGFKEHKLSVSAQRAVGKLAQELEINGFFTARAVLSGKTLLFNSVSLAPAAESVIDCMSSSCSLDLRKLWAKSLSCEPESEEAEQGAEKRRYTAAALRSFERSYLNSHNSILRKLGERLIFHGKSEDGEGDYIYIFNSASAEAMENGIKFITEDHS